MGQQALEELAASAEQAQGRVFLDAKLLLGKVLEDPYTGHVAVGTACQAGLEVILKKSQLRHVARALRPLPVVEAFYEVIDQQGHLCFRWRGGCGGLNLRSTLRPRDVHPDDVARVALPMVEQLPVRKVLAALPPIVENKPSVARARRSRKTVKAA